MDVGYASGPVITGLLVTVCGYQISFALITNIIVVTALIYADYMRNSQRTTLAA